MLSSRAVLFLALLPCTAAWSAPLGTRPARSAAVGLARRSAPIIANEEFTRYAVNTLGVCACMWVYVAATPRGASCTMVPDGRIRQRRLLCFTRREQMLVESRDPFRQVHIF